MLTKYSENKLLPFYKIIRPLNCIIGGLSLLVGVIVTLGIDILFENLFLIFIGIIIMYLVSAGGFVINDIIDIEIDKINTPHRILPSGAMSTKTAYYYMLILFFLSISLSIFSMSISTKLNLGLIPPIATIFGIISLIVYAKYLKNLGIIGNFLIAILTIVPFIIGGILLEDITRGLLPSAIVLSLIYSREIIKDILDVKGDVEASDSFYSLPALIGVKNTVWLARISLSILILCSFLPFLLEDFSFFRSFSMLGLAIIYLIIVIRIIFLLRGDSETISKNARKSKSLLKIGILFALIGLGLNPITTI